MYRIGNVKNPPDSMNGPRKKGATSDDRMFAIRVANTAIPTIILKTNEYFISPPSVTQFDLLA
jgi:hypothetical protein